MVTMVIARRKHYTTKVYSETHEVHSEIHNETHNEVHNYLQ